MNRFALTALALFSGAALFGDVPPTQLVDLKKVFSAAPVIYTILSLMSVASMAIWLYSLATFRSKELVPKEFIDTVRDLLKKGQFDEAHQICGSRGKILGAIVSAGLSNRKLGHQIMVEAMKSEGKRAATSSWQRLSLLNDIVIIAPMFGLLGTVIGMFYAFYDVNRSIESINSLFDGLGIAVGTTVAGLVVAIVSMVFYTTLKYRTVHTLGLVENEALALCPLIETR
jgi:biopolymer transport protein ExbB